MCHVVGSAQLFFNKNNQVRYCRVRHYVGLNEFKKPEVLQQITVSQQVSYSGLRKRLERKHLCLRFNGLSDKFGTHLLSHGILEAEINLLQGRIPVDIFIRHYWSPKLKELGNRIIKALKNIN